MLLFWLAVHLSPENTVRSGLAAIVLAGCLANLGRIGTHLHGEYLLLRPARIRASEKPTVRRHLNALVIADLTLTMMGMAGAIVLMAHPEAPLLWRVVPVFLLCLAFYLIALATVDRAGELKLDRGTEIVSNSRFGGWLFKIARKGTRFPLARWLVELFDNPTLSDEPSTLALVIAAVLLLAPVATVTTEASTAAKKQVIAALTKTHDHRSDATTADEPPQEPAHTNLIQASPYSVSHLHVIIGKTSTADPRTPIPLSPDDIPYVIAVLPLIARLTQMSTGSESSIYFLTHKDTTLSFKVIDK